jgi:hypothetical protein
MLEESGGVGGRGEDALEEVIVGLMEGMIRHAVGRVRAVHVHRAGRVDGWGESLGNRLGEEMDSRGAEQWVRNVPLREMVKYFDVG